MFDHFLNKNFKMSWQTHKLLLSICEFAYSLTFVCNPGISTSGALVVVCGHAQSSSRLGCLMHVVSGEVDALPLWFSSHSINKCHFAGQLRAPVFALLCLLLVISLFSGPQVEWWMPSGPPESMTESHDFSRRKCVCWMNRVTVLLALSSVLTKQ